MTSEEGLRRLIGRRTEERMKQLQGWCTQGPPASEIGGSSITRDTWSLTLQVRGGVPSSRIPPEQFHDARLLGPWNPHQDFKKSQFHPGPQDGASHAPCLLGRAPLSSFLNCWSQSLLSQLCPDLCPRHSSCLLLHLFLPLSLLSPTHLGSCHILWVSPVS